MLAFVFGLVFHIQSVLCRDATLPYLELWRDPEFVPEYYYKTTEAMKFGVSYNTASQIYERLDWHVYEYGKFCRETETEENENFLFLLRSMRTVYYHLREALDRRNSPYARVYHIHQLKLSLSVFCAGQDYHWFDLGILPIWH